MDWVGGSEIMPIIVCQRTECLYNKSRRCSCDIIGMDKTGCDSYVILPEDIREGEEIPPSPSE